MARKSRAAYLPLPGGQWFSRISLVFLAIFGISLMVMSKAGNPAVTRLRANITDLAAPVLAVAASPMDAIYGMGTWFKEMATLREENIALRNQNAQLLQWQTAAKQMAEENQSLRTLLNAVPTQKSTYITVRIVSDLGGPYVHSALINGGGNDGVKKDQAVVGENGLIGRVVEVGQASARILLLSDINSRIPVVAEHAREKGILSGNNSDLPVLSYLGADSRIQVGERIVTSGDGGVFPAGVPVGIVTSTEKGLVKVQPFVDPSQVEYVSVIDYAL